MTEKPCLKDENIYPDDAVLCYHLGKVKNTWDIFHTFIADEYPAFAGEWRYYKDGHNWLYKLVKKKKTICWVAILENKFVTTFYFGDKAEELITSSDLPQEYIEKFVHGKRYGKIRALTIEIHQPDDLELTKKLIVIKEKLK